VTNRLQSTARRLIGSYPRSFWIIAVADVFPTGVGHMLVFPFLAFYATNRFGVGMTQVGLLFTAMAVCDVLGSMLGGALSDRFGRKPVLALGQLGSGFAVLLMGWAESFPSFFTLAMLVCLIGSTGGPARSAMMTDLLPGEKLPAGFGILRVVGGLTFVIGPLIGGLLATGSYAPLFIIKFATNAFAAATILLTVRETRPAEDGENEPASLTRTLTGYRKVLRDVPFLLFLGATMLVFGSLGQVQRGALSVYLRDLHGISEQGFGLLMSLNGFLVILLQLPIAKLISRFHPMATMGAGALLIAGGFWIFGGSSSYGLFMAAMIVIAVGQMVLLPTNRFVIARLSPTRMRGRYIGAAGLGVSAAQAVGPVFAGLVMDHLDPRWVWYGAGTLGLIAVTWFLMLRRHTDPRLDREPAAHVSPSPARGST